MAYTWIKEEQTDGSYRVRKLRVHVPAPTMAEDDPEYLAWVADGNTAEVIDRRAPVIETESDIAQDELDFIDGQSGALLSDLIAVLISRGVINAVDFSEDSQRKIAKRETLVGKIA